MELWIVRQRYGNFILTPTVLYTHLALLFPVHVMLLYRRVYSIDTCKYDFKNIDNYIGINLH